MDIILDEGGYGWEPSLYVLAHNPLELIDRTHQIAAHIGEFNALKSDNILLFMISFSLSGCLGNEDSGDCEIGIRYSNL